MRKVSINNDPHRYDDMLKMPHHISQNHPAMARTERAAQFKPFAALNGYEEALQQSEKEQESWWKSQEGVS